MKKLFFILALLSPGLALTQTPPPAPASAADVTAGVATYKFISPYALSVSGVASNGITAAGATNIVNGMRTQAGFDIGGNAATATTASNLTPALTNWVQSQSGLYHPEDFGAISGDGLDDSAAWTACWNAARTNSQSTIDGRNRSYEINSGTIVCNPYNLINRVTVQNAVFISTNPALSTVLSNNANYSAFKNLWFGSLNNPNITTTALRCAALPNGNYPESTVIERCYFTNFFRQIWLERQDNAVVSGLS